MVNLGIFLLCPVKKLGDTGKECYSKKKEALGIVEIVQ